jgi:hypothetical protein
MTGAGDRLERPAAEAPSRPALAPGLEAQPGAVIARRYCTARFWFAPCVMGPGHIGPHETRAGERWIGGSSRHPVAVLTARR